MLSKIPERVKIYFIIGLSVLFVLVGYFRFFHGKIAPTRPASVAAPPVRIAVPAVDVKGLPTAGQAPQAVYEPRRGTLRNIFATGKFAPPKEVSAEAQTRIAAAESSNPLPSLKLTGTIIDGKKPLAIINGQFLREGERIEGFQVVSITRDQVTLTAEGRTLLLNVLDGVDKRMP